MLTNAPLQGKHYCRLSSECTMQRRSNESSAGFAAGQRFWSNWSTIPQHPSTTTNIANMRMPTHAMGPGENQERGIFDILQFSGSQRLHHDNHIRTARGK